MRTEVITLGATATFDSARFWPDENGITIKPLYELVNVKNLLAGTSDDVVTGFMVEVRFSPTKFSNTAVTKLYPHAGIMAARNGASIVGSTDKPLVIRSNDGYKRTIACAYVRQEPALRCKGGNAIFGEVVFRGIVGLTADASLAASYYALSAETWNDTGYDPDEEIRPSFYAQYKASAEDTSSWSNILIRADSELTITPKSELTPFPSQSRGLVNETINAYNVEISGSFLNISEAQILAAAYGDITLGSKITNRGRRLRIIATTGDAFIVIPNAVLRPDQEFKFDLKSTVVSKITWDSRPKFVEGAWQEHLIVSETDPDA